MTDENATAPDVDMAAAEAPQADEPAADAAAAAEAGGGAEDAQKTEPRKRSRANSAGPKSLDQTPHSPAEGGRPRKQTTFFQVEIKEKEEFVIKPGKGKKLGEIPNVHFHLSKLKTDDELLSALHGLLYKRPGAANKRKKNLYEFSGFTFDKEEQEKEMEKVRDRVGKWTLPIIHSALDVFELPRGSGDEGKKEAKIERLVKFLEHPKKMSDKDLAAQEAKKKEQAAKKREKAAAKKAKTSKKGSKSAEKPAKGGRAKKAEEEEDEEESESEEEEEAEEVEEEEVNEEEPEEKEEEEPPKKKAKKEKEEAKDKAEKEEKKKEVKKKAEKEKEEKKEGKKKEEKKEEKKEKSPAKAKKGAKAKADEGEEDDDDEPLGAVASGVGKVPSDEELKEAVLKTLKGVDVNAMTMKQLMTQLSSEFKLDLAAKKAFIKEVAVEYAKSQQPAEESAPAAEAATAADGTEA